MGHTRASEGGIIWGRGLRGSLLRTQALQPDSMMLMVVQLCLLYLVPKFETLLACTLPNQHSCSSIWHDKTQHTAKEQN